MQYITEGLLIEAIGEGWFYDHLWSKLSKLPWLKDRDMPPDQEILELAVRSGFTFVYILDQLSKKELQVVASCLGLEVSYGRNVLRGEFQEDLMTAIRNKTHSSHLIRLKSRWPLINPVLDGPETRWKDECPRCHGDGGIKGNCPKCGGSGIYRE